jgi:preprotein translocase subunit SecG
MDFIGILLTGFIVLLLLLSIIMRYKQKKFDCESSKVTVGFDLPIGTQVITPDGLKSIVQ